MIVSGVVHGEADYKNPVLIRVVPDIMDSVLNQYLDKPRQVEKFIHMNPDGSEGEIIDPKTNVEAEAAYNKFMKVVETFPERDANPRY